jgi:hypothetical protein
MLGQAQGAGASPPLSCPSCGRPQPASERFCPDCRLPLVPAADERRAQISARHERARKIKPQLAEGPLVRVASARNQAEGELLQGLLLEAGVPSLLRRSAGFDVPDFLAAGPRDVLVPQSGALTAREVLLDADVLDERPSRPPASPSRLLVGLIVVFAIGALIIWLGLEVLH